MAPVILNNSTQPGSGNGTKEIDKELKEGINNLKGSFYDLETGKVNYSAMKGSPPFEDYKRITEGLKYFDLKTLSTRETKLAFWINIYNSLVVDGIIQMDIKNSVREMSDFFGSVSYNINNLTFSLDDIEHGILRKNAKKHLLARRPFSGSDPRKEFIVGQIDPRIHFSLVCGSKSCPPIGTYQEDKIDPQLDIAAANFINGPDVTIDKESGRLKLSKIFKWYKNDFGSSKDLILFLASHRRDNTDKEFLRENYNQLSVTYLDYDWNLNH